MQCYQYEALCRTLVAYVKEQYPHVDFDMWDAADAIDDHGIESVAQLAELASIGTAVQRAA